ncbi:MAG TPA: sterol desaturase family protein [Mycobacteriales bacterium]|nr:sterol desaturase family protein [Mycobacteriales bacterium]
MTESRGATLREAARTFVTHPSPRLLLAGAAVSVGARALVGDWTAADAIVVGVLLVAQPFVEWLIHVYLLHWRPRQIAGRRIDPVPGRSHRRHHRDPQDPRFIFLYVRAVAGLLVLHLLGWTVAAVTSWAVATGLVTSLLLTLAYEWTHHLIHTTYVPRRSFYRSLWRAHRLHHFRNENYWYGVTSGLGDRVLGTYPKKNDVPLSPTATSLAQLSGRGV